ncbi:polysaccharide pyruvyl transferase family protein [Virgibacillus halodenitrificans]|uniref:Polysaccharide pyruvyl transferase family protein n=1 Tax=Virgibacillus halodenitrificans TaxID=1482 RepID=A0ABR7VHI7_VIRHA|nr:polysaccharide pyruvyl transferase family protein [Virgibacillus halodenitrificans]MBD1221409.1 polysaccharide pyruvyl transferase family protein [Virgibacillus halodenitrificans]
MRKLLIRAGMSPFDSLDASQIIFNNTIGGNVGNLVYQYSVYRTLMTEETTITPDYYDVNPRNAQYINENYDAYVIPLADAFRSSFIPALKKYTKLIKKLNIPVIVIGVGLRAPFEPKLREGFPFDDDVKEFVKAVLEKSSMIGVRGEITSKYLSRLGFKEGIDHTVIGCPSMYAFGSELKIKEANINKDSLICVNSSKLSQGNVLEFIARSMRDYPNHYFIPQWLKELVLGYAGGPPLDKPKNNYPCSISDPVYRNDRVRFFLNVPTWLDFLSKADLSVGARLHGNITATLAGTPSIILPKDARMRELTEYHGLTHVWWNDISENTHLEDLVEKVDFQSPTKKQETNFTHFIDFLNKNNLEHIYIKGESSKTPFDNQVKNIEYKKPVKPITSCSGEELVERFKSYYPMVEEVKELQSEVKKKNRQIEHLKGTLNRKSVRAALRAAKLFEKKR